MTKNERNAGRKLSPHPRTKTVTLRLNKEEYAAYKVFTPKRLRQFLLSWIELEDPDAFLKHFLEESLICIPIEK